MQTTPSETLDVDVKPGGCLLLRPVGPPSEIVNQRHTPLSHTFQCPETAREAEVQPGAHSSGCEVCGCLHSPGLHGSAGEAPDHSGAWPRAHPADGHPTFSTGNSGKLCFEFAPRVGLRPELEELRCCRGGGGMQALRPTGSGPPWAWGRGNRYHRLGF